MGKKHYALPKRVIDKARKDYGEVDDLVTIIEGNQVVVDGEFTFPLDYTIMNALLWNPLVDGNRLVGLFRGVIHYQWVDENTDDPGDKYYGIRMRGIDRLVPAWSAVEKGLEGTLLDTKVLLIYRGKRQLPNGRTWHNVMVGKSTHPPDDLTL